MFKFPTVQSGEWDIEPTPPATDQDRKAKRIARELADEAINACFMWDLVEEIYMPKEEDWGYPLRPKQGAGTEVWINHDKAVDEASEQYNEAREVIEVNRERLCANMLLELLPEIKVSLEAQVNTAKRRPVRRRRRRRLNW